MVFENRRARIWRCRDRIIGAFSETNAVVTWNTVYMAAVIEQLRSEGRTVNDEDISRLSPARYEHINPYGKYRFEVEEGLSRTRLRPLRPPTEHQSR